MASAGTRKRALDDLFDAARENDVDGLNATLSAGLVDVRARDARGYAATHHAAALGGVEALEVLIRRRGADADAEDARGRGPLHHAAANGRDECARFLIDSCDAWIDACDGRDESALVAACRQGEASTVEALLGRGADASLKNVDGCDAFAEAVCVRGDATIGRLLVKSGVDPRRARVRCGTGEANASRSALNVACALGHVEAVRFLVEECGLDAGGSDCGDCDYMTPLMAAAMMGEADVVEYLLLSGAASTAHLKSEDNLTAADMFPSDHERTDVKRKLASAVKKAMSSPKARSVITAPKVEIPSKWAARTSATSADAGGDEVDQLEVRLRAWISAGVNKFDNVPDGVRKLLEKHAAMTKEIELRAFLLGMIEDERFQEDMQQREVRQAVDEVIASFHNVSKYRDNARIMGVLTKFRHVQRFCKDRGEKISFDDILASDEDAVEEHRERLAELRASAGTLWDDALLALRTHVSGQDVKTVALKTMPVVTRWTRLKFKFEEWMENDGAHAIVAVLFAMTMYYFTSLGGFQRLLGYDRASAI